ncbi:site-specific integrase [Rivihabitans pingtungensis]|uniref:site-specific integrase n=1 Tax=Rivihabitans pingtungensis TaxID=1054498 RepID=UPI0023532B27|nr:site-specific integrase [Rivihabitans pingtungensis]MCK6436000.1 site-specific integrase [Rivihabitans pingtungensis]
MGKTRIDRTGITAASASSIEIAFTYQGRRCRERIKLKPTPANLDRAALHRAAIIAAIADGTFNYAVTFPDSKHASALAASPGDAITVASWLDTFVRRSSRQLKSSTLRDYRNTVNNALIPAFGQLALADLRRPAIRAWCSTLECGNKRIGNMLSIMRAALDAAVDDELIEQNPLARWTYRRREPLKTDDIDPFSAAEQMAILENMEPAGRNMIQFAFWTGLRTSELIALEWADIDFLRGYARIDKALTQAADAEESTKTRAGRRDVKLLAPALAALSSQKSITYLTGGKIFINPRTREPWCGDQAIRKTLWTPALKRAGVRYRRPYQTRHTYASMMLSAGESPMWVASQMGHADWTMIARVYGRWIPDAAPDAGAMAVSLFAGEGQKKMLAKKLSSAAN